MSDGGRGPQQEEEAPRPPSLLRKLSRRVSRSLGSSGSGSSWRKEESFYSTYDGKRWHKGREWDGMGDWCDPLTASEYLDALEEMLLDAKDESILKCFDFAVTRLGDKRALTYVDGKVRQAGRQAVP
jgi:hypothetical protein